MTLQEIERQSQLMLVESMERLMDQCDAAKARALVAEARAAQMEAVVQAARQLWPQGSPHERPREEVRAMIHRVSEWYPDEAIHMERAGVLAVFDALAAFDALASEE